MIPCNHQPGSDDACEFCQRYLTDARYRSLVDRAPGEREENPAGPECMHRGDPVPVYLIVRMPLVPSRAYVECGRGRGDVPGIVCVCACTAKACPEFLPANSAAADKT